MEPMVPGLFYLSKSDKNGWIDDENRVYIIYTYENIMQDLNCAKATCAKAIAELCDKGLILKDKRGQGNPDIIYIKNFISEEKTRSSENELTEVQELNPNNTEYKSTDINQTDRGSNTDN